MKKPTRSRTAKKRSSRPLHAVVRRLKGYKHIIDDGEASGHGYILTKPSSSVKAIPDGGCSMVNVPRKKLLNALQELSKKQTERMKEIAA